MSVRSKSSRRRPSEPHNGRKGMSEQTKPNTTEVVEKIKSHLNSSAEVKRQIAEALPVKIAEAATLITECFRSGGKVVLLGNGGSAADAQHLAAELVGRFKMERDALPAMALTTNTSILTALGNDYGYDAVFAKQVQAWAQVGDVVIGISTSGNSPNVVSGMEKARELGARTIALTGGGGGKMAEVADLPIVVPSSDTPRIQEGHIAIGHVICHIVEESLFGTAQDPACRF